MKRIFVLPCIAGVLSLTVWGQESAHRQDDDCIRTVSIAIHFKAL
jgi:hypothetical protein